MTPGSFAAAIWIILAFCAVVIVARWESQPIPRAPYVNVQTCVYPKNGEVDAKPAWTCDRLNPGTHWALRQRI